MTIALSTLLQGFEEYIESISVVSIADVGSDDTKIVDAALSIYGDTWFNDWWGYVTSGDAEGDVRQIETHTKADTTLDPFVDFSAAVGVGDDYELHKYNVDSIIRAINDAIISLYSSPPRPKLFRKIVFESLGVSLLTSNADAAQADVVVADATLFFVGQEVTVSDDDASEDATIKSIATNTLTMEDNLTNAYTTAANAKVTAKSGKYFNLGATIGNARVMGLCIRTDEHSTRHRVTGFRIIQSLAGARQIYFPYQTVSVDDQTLIIEAIDKLEELTTPASTITLEDRLVKLLYAETAYHLYDKQANQISSGDWDRLKALATNYQRKVYEDFKGLWMPMPIEVADITTDSD